MLPGTLNRVLRDQKWELLAAMGHKPDLTHFSCCVQQKRADNKLRGKQTCSTKRRNLKVDWDRTL